MAFLSSVLAGCLVGAGMPLRKSASYTVDGSEHFFYAIDIRQFVDLAEFYAEIDATVAGIRGLPPVEGFDVVRLPGELEWEALAPLAARGHSSPPRPRQQARRSRHQPEAADPLALGGTPGLV